MHDKFYQKLCEKDIEIFRLKQKLRETESEKNQEISEKDLEIYKLKQMLREAEMNKKYESPYESSFVSKNMHNVGIELQPVRYIEKRKVENGADDSEREKRLKRAKEKHRKFLENNKKKSIDTMKRIFQINTVNEKK